MLAATIRIDAEPEWNVWTVVRRNQPPRLVGQKHRGQAFLIGRFVERVELFEVLLDVDPLESIGRVDATGATLGTCGWIHREVSRCSYRRRRTDTEQVYRYRPEWPSDLDARSVPSEFSLQSSLLAYRFKTLTALGRKGIGASNRVPPQVCPHEPQGRTR
jgi:hypothetical protein